jgi:glucose-6-phosphate 1-dehydrogenase
VELAWEIIDPFVEAWHRSVESQLFEYDRGSSGPAAAESFLANGRHWHSHKGE